MAKTVAVHGDHHYPGSYFKDEIIIVTHRNPNLTEFLLVSIVTFVLMLTEALVEVHYGKTGRIGLSFPPLDELLVVITTLSVFTILSSVIVILLKKLLGITGVSSQPPAPAKKTATVHQQSPK